MACVGVNIGALTVKVVALFDKAVEHVSPALCGEVIPTVGKGLEPARGMTA